MVDEPNTTNHSYQQNALNPHPAQPGVLGGNQAYPQKPATEQTSVVHQDQRSGYNPVNSGPDNKTKPVADETQNEDHHGRIRELAVELRNASPSGANSISDKILFHLDAIADPKAYNERMSKEKKAADELEAKRAKDRAANKQPVPEKAKA